MIWSVVSREEMGGFGTNPVFRFYREAIGKGNIRLAVVEESDSLDFVCDDDIVLLRTASQQLVETIVKRRIVSTAESWDAYKLTSDKAELSKYMSSVGIQIPRQISLKDVVDGRKYIVKPRYGSDSMGISSRSICVTKEEVTSQIKYLRDSDFGEIVIEEFIDGEECTCAVWMENDNIVTCAISIECDETCGIQTRECKVGFKECCSAMQDNEIEETSKKVFDLLGLKHHARIDFRRGKEDGIYYMIDVNLMPGLGPLDHFAKCLLLCRNKSYADAIKAIISSASR